MRFLLDISCPTEPFNSLIRNGSVGALLQEILADAKPEAVYFTERMGARGLTMIVDLASASDIPRFAEPWFLKFDAAVEMHPVMTPEDLGASGIEALGKRWS